MRDIDEIFNEMEISVIKASSGWGSLIVNVGMILVILTSAMLWLKMRNYEVKQ